MSTPIKKLKEEGEVFFPLTSSVAVLTPNGQPLTNSLVELEDYSSTDGTESLPSSGGGALYEHTIATDYNFDKGIFMTILSYSSVPFTKDTLITYLTNNYHNNSTWKMVSGYWGSKSVGGISNNGGIIGYSSGYTD